jgi:5-methylcytosine-specific restriction endonuclease McrA
MRPKGYCRECRLSQEDFETMCDWFGNRCLRCGGGGRLHADHVIAHARGGSNSLRNMQPLCGSCNKRKQTTYADYRDPVLLAELLQFLGY